MARSVLTESDVHLIVLELLNCSDLVRNTDMLCGGLGIFGSNLADINKVSGKRQSYNLLKLVLEKWISLKGVDATIDTLAHILSRLGFKKTADSIRQNPVFESTEDSIWHEVPETVPNFVGREEELQKVQEFFDSSTIEKSRKVMVVSGLGGIGKSELAKMVAKRFEDPVKNVVWILAENNQTLTQCFKMLALEKLNIRTENSDGTEVDVARIVESVYKSLATKSSLVIFDNAESYKENKQDDLFNFLPESFNFRPSFNFPNILITTRFSDFIPFVGKIELEGFKPKDSNLFLTMNLSCSTNDYDTEELSKVFENFPLALQQAVAYINQESIVKNNYGIQEYLMEFQKRAELLLDLEFRSDSGIPYTKTTMITWALTLEKIHEIADYGKSAIEILQIIAYLAADNIELSLLQQILATTEDHSIPYLVIEEGLLILRKYTMIKFNNGLANVHRLVQQVTRLHLVKTNIHFEVGTKIMKTFKKLLDSECFELKNVPHLISAWRHCSECPELTAKFKAVPATMVEFLTRKIKWSEAILFGKEALTTIQTQLPDDERHVLNLKYNLGYALLSAGHYDLAIHYFVQVLKAREETLGIDHPDTLDTKHNIGTTYYRQGKYDIAMEIYEDVLKKREESLGGDHPDTLLAKQNIAVKYDNQANYDRALEILEEVLQKMEATLGNDHPITLTSLHNIAVIYNKQGKYDRALERHKVVLKKREKILGSDHPNTLLSWHYIATTYESQGNYDRALVIYEDVLKKMENTLGDNHPDTLRTMHCIAVMYNYYKGNSSRALRMLEEVLAKREVTLGIDHPDTLETKHNIAETYQNNKNYDKALQLYGVLLMKREETLGSAHPDTLKTKHSIAVTYHDNGNYDQALELHGVVLKKRVEVLGSAHPDTLLTRHAIANVYSKQENYARAVEIYEEVLKKVEETLGIDHPETLSTKHNIATTYYRQEIYDKALEMYKDVLKKIEVTLGFDHPDTLRIRENIAAVYCNQGNYDRASEILEDVLKKREAILGIDHPDTLNTKHNSIIVKHGVRQIIRLLSSLSAAPSLEHSRTPPGQGMVYGISHLEELD